MKALIKAVLQWSVAGMLISLSQAIEPVGGYTTESVTHGQTCDARPTVTFSAAEYHHHLATASTKLYCLVTEAHVCVWTTCPVTWKRNSRESNLRRVGRKSNVPSQHHLNPWDLNPWDKHCGMISIQIYKSVLFLILLRAMRKIMLLYYCSLGVSCSTIMPTILVMSLI